MPVTIYVIRDIYSSQFRPFKVGPKAPLNKLHQIISCLKCNLSDVENQMISQILDKCGCLINVSPFSTKNIYKYTAIQKLSHCGDWGQIHN